MPLIFTVTRFEPKETCMVKIVSKINDEVHFYYPILAGIEEVNGEEVDKDLFRLFTIQSKTETPKQKGIYDKSNIALIASPEDHEKRLLFLTKNKEFSTEDEVYCIMRLFGKDGQSDEIIFTKLTFFTMAAVSFDRFHTFRKYDPKTETFSEREYLVYIAILDDYNEYIEKVKSMIEYSTIKPISFENITIKDE